MIEIGSFQENEAHLQALYCCSTQGKISGGLLINFKEGWALQIFGASKVHYIKTYPNGHLYSLCGCHVNDGDLFAQGNFDACKSCLRIAKLQNLALPTTKPAIESK